MLAASGTDAQTKKHDGLEWILQPVRSYMDELNRFLDRQTEEFEPETAEMVRYCLRSKGKRIRTLLLFYSGWGGEGQLSEAHIQAAAVVELVHLATLVHDDILDDATIRHNDYTVSQQYGVSTAVLLGDALFSHALKLASDFPTVEVCRAVSLSTRRVCAGEIQQTFQRGNPDLGLDDYFRMIELKTAELFKVSCQLGASLSGYPKDFVQAAAAFGNHLGVAYQIFDDMADFLGEEKKIGKTLGTDLGSGKYTLPLLLLLQKLDDVQRQTLINRLRKGEFDRVGMLAMMESLGVIEASRVFFERAIQAADQALAPFSDNPASAMLARLSEMVVAQMDRLSAAR